MRKSQSQETLYQEFEMNEEAYQKAQDKENRIRSLEEEE